MAVEGYESAESLIRNERLIEVRAFGIVVTSPVVVVVASPDV